MKGLFITLFYFFSTLILLSSVNITYNSAGAGVLNPEFVYDNNINIYPLLDLNQLPSNSVRYTYQDKEGFLWIATDNGLCLYDGYNTKVFRHDSHGKILRNNRISYITEDRKGRIWFCSVNGGFVIDKNDGYKLFSPDKQMSNCKVSWIEVLENNDILVALTGTILRFDENLNLISSHKIKVKSDEYINQLIQSEDGDIFVLMHQSGVFKYDTETGKTIRYENDFKSIRYNRIIRDSDNEYFWITTSNCGILRFNPYAINQDSIFITQKSTINNSKFSDSFLYLKIDPVHGDLWTISRSEL